MNSLRAAAGLNYNSCRNASSKNNSSGPRQPQNISTRNLHSSSVLSLDDNSAKIKGAKAAESKMLSGCTVSTFKNSVATRHKNFSSLISSKANETHGSLQHKLAGECSKFTQQNKNTRNLNNAISIKNQTNVLPVKENEAKKILNSRNHKSQQFATAGDGNRSKRNIKDSFASTEGGKRSTKKMSDKGKITTAKASSTKSEGRPRSSI